MARRGLLREATRAMRAARSLLVVAVCSRRRLSKTGPTRLAAQGLKGRKVPDLVNAAIAEATSLTVLHYDADLDHIATVTGQSTQWVVERGSID